MRDPRAGLMWTQGRLDRRATYGAYMSSAEWWLTREWWHAEYVRIIGHEPSCAACGAGWTLRHGDLHHRSYERLGHERFGDLVALCRPCHTEVHRRIEQTGVLHHTSRGMATDLAMRRMALEKIARQGAHRASENSHRVPTEP